MLSKIIISVLALSTTFAFTFAQGYKDTLCLSCFGDFINDANKYVVAAVGTLLLAVSVVGFFLGVVRFIWAQQNGNEKGVTSGKQTLLWGLIALFCAFSVYGIITFGQNIFFTNSENATNIRVPKFIIDTPPTGDGSFPTGSAGAGGRLPTETSPSTFPTGKTRSITTPPETAPPIYDEVW